jgi:hypothetical protein
MKDRDGLNLRELQALLYRLITAPEGVAAGLKAEAHPVDLNTIISGDERIGAANRLGIYADAYFYRVLDALREDFPAILAVVGEDEFHNLITGYLVAYPPTEPSLLDAGRHLGEYLESTVEFDRWPFLTDLARLERALIESFHAANVIPLDGATMQSIPPAEWPGVPMRLHPSVRLVRVGWRIDEVVRAVVQHSIEVPRPSPEPITLIIWRQRNEALYRAAEPAEAIALHLLQPWADFASICEAIADASDGSDTPNLINRLLARWLADGLLLPPAAREAHGTSPH